MSTHLCAQQPADQDSEEMAPDLFTGTIALAKHEKSKANQAGKAPVLELRLKRCDLAQNQYWLLDGSNQPLQQFMQKYATALKAATDAAHQIQATVVGAYQEKQGENYLIVQRIEEIQPDTSCHLMDMFP